MNSFDFAPFTEELPPARVATISNSPAGASRADAGQSPNPWHPFTVNYLPGVQVVITAHNAEPWLERCLASVETALRGFRWILILIDDDSTDRTLRIAVNHRTHAQHIILRSFPKAANVSVAKNRAFVFALKNRTDYPAIVAMDADDEMTPERVKHLLPAAVSGGHLAVMGDYQYFCPHDPARHLAVIPAREENVLEGKFGPPMTLFHCSLIPRNGLLFREDFTAFSDCALWLAWRQRGIGIHPVPGKIVHLYHYRNGSTSNPTNRQIFREGIDRYHATKKQILAGEASSAHPRVSALMITGKCPERYPLARVAVQCFKDQTWPEKELVIINHGEVSLADGDPRIREFRVIKEPGMTLGDLRNLSLEHARGDFVIQWDDDDFHHESRIETMMQYHDRGQVVTIAWQIRYNICNGSAYYHHAPGGQQMAILHPASIPYRYPRLDSREDTIFLENMWPRHVIENPPGNDTSPLLYVRLFHQRNVWHENHVMEKLAGRHRVMEISPEHQAELKRIEAIYRGQPDFALP